jgi:hypothetical protein
MFGINFDRFHLRINWSFAVDVAQSKGKQNTSSYSPEYKMLQPTCLLAVDPSCSCTRSQSNRNDDVKLAIKCDWRGQNSTGGKPTPVQFSLLQGTLPPHRSSMLAAYLLYSLKFVLPVPSILKPHPPQLPATLWSRSVNVISFPYVRFNIVLVIFF